MSDELGKVNKKESFINLAVIENRKGEVLMIRRNNKETSSKGGTLEWAFPGGKQRLGESREQSLTGDVLEETGYEIRPVKQLHIRMHPQFPVCAVYHLCALLSEMPAAEPREPHEVAEIRWVQPADIRSLITTDLDPAVAQALRITQPL